MRSTSLLYAALAVGLLALVVASLLAAPVGADIAPMADPPTTDGPHEVGFYYDDVQTSTKGYSTPVLVYYPAFNPGERTEPNPGSGPYPAVIWLPFFGGDRLASPDVCNRLASWGFVVMAVSVNWGDFPNSANPSDIEDLLDHIEACDANSSSLLHGMVDTARYGISGYSSGGGLALLDGAYVDRISAVQTFAAAIGVSTVDSIASRYATKPVLLQIGDQDADYIAGSRRAYERFSCTRSLVEIKGAGHGGPFVLEQLVAFYLYHLTGVCGILEWVYGGKAVEGVVSGRYMLYFRIPNGDFFPPTVTASASTTNAPMDAPVDFNGTITGFYYPAGHPGCAFEWDFDDDGQADASNVTSLRASHAFTRPGTVDIGFWYRVGTMRAEAPGTLSVTVTNVPPVARVAGDTVVDQDAVAAFDASGSSDTLSDLGHLTYKWDFGDGGPPVWTPFPDAAHIYTARDAYTLTVTVMDLYGAEASATLEVMVVNVAPTAEAGADLVAEEDTPLAFRGAGDDTPSDIASLWFRWDFGDGMTSDWSLNATADHVYTLTGDYVVTLTVRDSANAVARDRMNVSISNIVPTCVISSPVHMTLFDMDTAVGFEGLLIDTTSDQPSLRCRWDFGDGTDTGWSSPLGASTTHAFTTPGTYTVRLEVDDDDGATAESTIDLVIVNVGPFATVERPGVEVNVTEDVLLVLEGSGTDTASDADDLDLTWVVDGVRMPGARVEVSFATSGAHEARLVVTDPYGATAEAVVRVTVRNIAPDVDAAVSPVVLLEGQTVNFSCTPYDTPSDEAGLGVLWEFGDGGNSTESEGRHVFERAGNYTVSVTVTDDDGEMAVKTFTVRVTAPPPPPPPPPAGDGDRDDVGGPSVVLVGVAIGLSAVIVVAFTLAVVMLRRRTGPAAPTDVEKADGPRNGP